MSNGPRFVLPLSAAFLLQLVACGGSHAGPGAAIDSGAGASSSSPGGSGPTTDGDGGASDATASSGGGGGGDGGCGSGDPRLPPEPTVPPACATLQATQAIAPGMLPSETNLDTTSIQAALASCAPGQAVRLTTSDTNNAFVSGPLRIPSGVTLSIDAGITLYASRNMSLYGGTCGMAGGSCVAVITVAGTNQGIMGDGVIDGQGGEPLVGQVQSWWGVNSGSNGAAAIPALVRVNRAINFTMYRITLHNSPKFHVVLGSKGFVVWGVTIKTPSVAVNSQGTALSASSAPNTDGIDPGQQASDGFIVCSKISVGDDQIALKGGAGVTNVTIAHNHFGFGHGMSIGSETNGGVSNISVYDLSIDGTGSGMGGGSSNGIRIKSDPSVGGVVSGVTYDDVCVRNVRNPIILTPRYSSATGTSIPEYTGITIRNFHALAGTASQTVTLDGYDAAHLLGLTLDNVVVDGLASANVRAAYANVTLGPGSVNFTPSGTSVTVNATASGNTPPNPCTDKWVSF